MKVNLEHSLTDSKKNYNGLSPEEMGKFLTVRTSAG